MLCVWVETGDDYGGDTMFRVVSPSIMQVSGQVRCQQVSNHVSTLYTAFLTSHQGVRERA